MTSHTPGPWEWSEVPLLGIQPTPAEPAPKAWPLQSRHEGWTAVLRHQAPWAVSPSDARLIAAAPQLLEACEAALSSFSCREDAPFAVDRIVAAIAAATGKG